MPTAIFGDALELEVSCSSHAHDERFLDVIGVTDLRHVFYNKIPAERMEDLAALLSSHLVPDGALRDVVWIFVFAHGDICTDDSVEPGSTHAVSVFSAAPRGMAHRYFERAGRTSEKSASSRSRSWRCPTWTRSACSASAPFPSGSCRLGRRSTSSRRRSGTSRTRYETPITPCARWFS